MIKRALAALLLSLSSLSYAEPLSNEELVGTAVLLTTLVIDYKQTLDIKNHPGMYERNPIMGRHPSDAEIRRYFGLAALGSVAMIYMLPKEYRMMFIGGAVTMQLVVIGNNKSIGLHTNF